MSQPHRDSRIKATLVARLLLTPAAQNLCKCEDIIFTNTSFYRGFSQKEFVGITHEVWRNKLLPRLTQKQFWVSRNTLKMINACLLEQLWTFWASAVKLICKFFLTDEHYETTFSCYVGVNKAYNTAVIRVAFWVEHCINYFSGVNSNIFLISTFFSDPWQLFVL